MVYCFCVLSRESSSAHQLGDRTSYIGDKRPLLIFLGVLEGLAEVAVVATVGVGIAALAGAIVLSTPAIAACFAGAALAAVIALGVIKANQHVSKGEPTTEEDSKLSQKPSPNAPEPKHQSELASPKHQPVLPEEGSTERSPHQTPSPNAPELEHQPESSEQGAIEGPTERSPLPLTTRSVSCDYRSFLFNHQVEPDLGPCYLNLSIENKIMLRRQVYNDLCSLLEQGGESVKIPIPMLNGGKAELSKTREGSLCIHCKAGSLAAVKNYVVSVNRDGGISVYCPNLIGEADRAGISVTLLNDNQLPVESLKIIGLPRGHSMKIEYDCVVKAYGYQRTAESEIQYLPEVDVINSLGSVTVQFLTAYMDRITSHLRGETISGKEKFEWLLSFFGSIRRDHCCGGHNASMLEASPLSEGYDHLQTIPLVTYSDVQTDSASGVVTITSHPITNCAHIAQDSTLKLIIKIYPNETITIEIIKTSVGRGRMTGTAERRVLFVQERALEEETIKCHIVKGNVTDIDSIESESLYRLFLSAEGNLMTEGLGATRHVASSFLAHHYIQTEACVVQDSTQTDMFFIDNCFETLVEVVTDPASMFVRPGKGLSRGDKNYLEAGLVRVCDGKELALPVVFSALRNYQQNTKATHCIWNDCMRAIALGFPNEQINQLLEMEEE